jgi:hypothetical protein
VKKIATSLLIVIASATAMLGFVELGRAEAPVVQIAQASGAPVADTPRTGPVIIPAFTPDAPATETSTAAPEKPSDKIHDPITEPGAAWDDVKAAKKIGWAAAVFAVLLVIGRLASRAKSIGFLGWLGKGRTAIVVAGALAVAAGCYDVAVQGGSPLSMAVAGLLALGVYMKPEKAE